MSVIAWDGKTLAADKRITFQGLARTTTKIFRVDSQLMAMCGSAGLGREMLEWIRDGLDAERLPALQRDKDEFCPVLLIRHDYANGNPFPALYLFERSPVPVRIEDAIFAMGSGRDYALTAMHLGKSAREAVEVACHFEVSCGNGIDELTL